MTVDEAQRLAALKQQIPASDRSLHEQALVTLSAAYEAREAIVQAAIEWEDIPWSDPNKPKELVAQAKLVQAVASYRGLQPSTPLERNA